MKRPKLERPVCSLEDCKTLVDWVYAKKYNKIYYRKLCRRHYQEKLGIRDKWQEYRWASKYGMSVKEFRKVKITGCSACGWNKTTCDLHRKIDGKNGGKYTKDNIIILCPNCHRLIHRGLINL